MLPQQKNIRKYIRKYNRTKCRALFDTDEKYERVFDRIRYLDMLKSNISDAYSQKFPKIKINSDDDVPIQSSLLSLLLLSNVFRKCIYKYFINAIYYDGTDISQGIDVNKKSASKMCITCHYWYFLDKGFRFQQAVCNECYDLLISIDINSFIQGLYYRKVKP